LRFHIYRIRSLIVTQQKDEDLRVFADQLLTSREWYRGYNYDGAESAFKEMIDNMHIGKYDTVEQTVNMAANQVAGTWREPSQY
jgi:hypothetical protein